MNKDDRKEKLFAENEGLKRKEKKNDRNGAKTVKIKRGNRWTESQ